MQQPLCHHEATSTRLKAGLPKGGGEHKVREILSLMMASYLPALGCLLLDWSKRDPDLIKPPRLEFSVIHS